LQSKNINIYKNQKNEFPYMRNTPDDKINIPALLKNFGSLNMLSENLEKLLSEKYQKTQKQKRYYCASMRNHYDVLKSTKTVEYHKPVVNKKTDYQFTANHAHKKTIHTKTAGTESSVLSHIYNDCSPIACSPYNVKQPVYEAKNIINMWVPNPIDYDSAMILKKNLGLFLRLSPTERANYMECVTDIRYITPDDCINNACDNELTGHRGLFAKHDLPAFCIIGVYSGVFLKDESDFKTLCKTFNPRDISDYLFRVSEEHEWPKISAYQTGNRLTLANAATNYKNGLDAGLDQVFIRRNLITTYAKSLECPFTDIKNNPECPDMVFLITCRPVRAGEQLLYDYGPVYWLNNDK
jgi:hypothetical protein